MAVITDQTPATWNRRDQATFLAFFTLGRRGEDAIRSAEKIIDELPTSERQEVLKCFDDLCSQLPDEALVA